MTYILISANSNNSAFNFSYSWEVGAGKTLDPGYGIN